jgi:ribosomal protein L15
MHGRGFWPLVSEQSRTKCAELCRQGWYAKPSPPLKGNVAPTIHVEKLWSLVSEQSRKPWADKKDKAPVIDVMKTGYTKVIGKRKPPEHPVIVIARYFTKTAEGKI